MKHIYVGIDYSLKSPAICILKNKQYKWLSHPKALEKKAELKKQEEVSTLKDVELIFQSEQESSESYSKNEYSKITHYRQQALTIIGMILKNVSVQEIRESVIHIGFEGYSFGSTSNNLIDLVGATTAIKVLIIEKNVFPNFTLDIYSPKAIKKLAGYGSYDKTDLFDVFINQYSFIRDKYKEQIAKDKKGNFKLDYSDDFLRGDFHNHCSNLELNRNVKKVKIPKPIDDLIDAYFISRCLWESYPEG